MTTKAESKAAASHTTQKTPEQEDLRIAYEIHTLAQMVYGQITMANPCSQPTYPLAGFPQPSEWPVMTTSVLPNWSTPSGGTW